MEATGGDTARRTAHTTIRATTSAAGGSAVSAAGFRVGAIRTAAAAVFRIAVCRLYWALGISVSFKATIHVSGEHWGDESRRDIIVIVIVVIVAPTEVGTTIVVLLVSVHTGTRGLSAPN